MSWICPACLSTNDTDVYTCSCGLTINEDVMENFGESITPSELLKEISSYSFIDAQERVELLTFYLIKRFPDSSEAQDLKLSLDTSSGDIVGKYFSSRVSKPKPSNLISCPDCDASISKRAVVCPHCGCPIAEIIASNPDLVHPAKRTPIQPAQVESFPAQRDFVSNVPRCPTCGSTNVERISLKSKAGKVLLVGIFAIGRVAKSFKCNTCKHQW